MTVDEARAARGVVEEALDNLGVPWPWHQGLSRLVDLWLLVEEGQ